jgi:hypothetical protein
MILHRFCVSPVRAEVASAWFMVYGYIDIENRSRKPYAARIGQRFWFMPPSVG